MGAADHDRETTVLVVGAAILRDGRCLVTRRGPTMRLAGKWEFPGGKVEPTESPVDALAREIREELGIAIRVGDRVGRGFAAIDEGRRVQLDVYEARWIGGTLALLEHDQARWCPPAELARLDWAEADIPVVPAVAARLDPGAR